MARTVFTVLLTLCLLGITSCGDDDGDDGGTSAAGSDEAQTKKVDVERFLIRAGEEPGFEPMGEPRTDRGVQALAGGFASEDVERLRRGGFISITFQPLTGGDHNAGVSTVVLFRTAEGARDWLEYETSDEGIDSAIPGAKPKRFEVRGVPGARGWTGRDRHGNPIGHVYWVQGRCELVIGNEGRGDFVRPLSIGARAVYDRTKGECPA